MAPKPERQATCCFLPPGASVNRQHPTLCFHWMSTHPHAALTHRLSISCSLLLSTIFYSPSLPITLSLFFSPDCLRVVKEKDRRGWYWGEDTDEQKRHQGQSEWETGSIISDPYLYHNSLMHAPVQNQSEYDTHSWSFSVSWSQRHAIMLLPPWPSRLRDWKAKRAVESSTYKSLEAAGRHCMTTGTQRASGVS